jgi:hypothetical protein
MESVNPLFMHISSFAFLVHQSRMLTKYWSVYMIIYILEMSVILLSRLICMWQNKQYFIMYHMCQATLYSDTNKS